MVAMIDIKRKVQQIIWSVAPVSIIQGEMCVGWDECVLVLKQVAIPETQELLTWGLGMEEDGCVTDSKAMTELVSLECKRESNYWY